ncbi:MAG: NAD(P)H-dependent oxidoreductase subunit E [Victivallaceae bacterium]
MNIELFNKGMKKMYDTVEKKREMVDRILEKNHHAESRLIPILQEIQEEHKFLSRDLINYVAVSIGVPPSHVYGVATFYAHFSLNPKDKHIFKLCDGTACHVKKSHGILEALYEKLGLSKEKNTTDDMLFTVETVSCLGACGLAPVMLVNDQVYGQVTPEQAEKIVDELRETEKNAQERNMENE